MRTPVTLIIFMRCIIFFTLTPIVINEDSAHHYLFSYTVNQAKSNHSATLKVS